MLAWGLPIIGSGVLAGVGWIARTLTAQNKGMEVQGRALAVLIAQVDPAIKNIDRTGKLEVAVAALETRMRALDGQSA